MEGAWSFPDSPKKVEALNKMLRHAIPAGKAEEMLTHILGNDDLMNEINIVKDHDPEIPVNDLVMQWLRHNYHDTFVQVANTKDWEGHVRPEDELLDNEGYYTPLGHGFQKPK